MGWDIGNCTYDVTSKFCDHNFAVLRKRGHTPIEGSQSGPIRIFGTEFLKRSKRELIDLVGIGLLEVSKDR